MRKKVLLLALVLSLLALGLLTACQNPVVEPPPAAIRVLDSLNGSPIAGASIVVKDVTGATTVKSATADSDGVVLFSALALDTAKTYSIFASKSGFAGASYVGYNSGKETYVTLYCHKLGMINFPATAPVITKYEISGTGNGSDWIDLPISSSAVTSYSGLLSGIAYIRVTAVARSGISPTAWSGFGIGINVDRTTWIGDMVAATRYDETSALVTSGTYTNYYESKAVFPVKMTNLAANSTHYLDIVVYDVANNRTEQKIYMTLTDSASAGSDPDIASMTPSLDSVEFRTWGLSQNFFAPSRTVTNVDSGTVSYGIRLSFSMSSNPGIRGFEVYRSLDNNTYSLIATYHFNEATLDHGTNGAYTRLFTDIDATLSSGTTYYYKIRAFTRAGYSKYSAYAKGEFLDLFTTRLTSPATNSISTTLGPTLSFTVSNSTLFSAAKSDYFYFMPVIKDKTGSMVYAVFFRYNFINGVFEKSTDNSTWTTTTEASLASDNMTISVVIPSSPTPLLIPSATYEWSIFGGVDSGTWYAPYFIKTYSGGIAIAKTYGSDYDHSYGALNGYFTLIVSPSAQ